MTSSSALLPEFLERKACAVCDGDRSEVLYSFTAETYPHDRFETASWDGRQSIPLSIVRCLDCQLVYANPSFRAEYLGLIYRDDLVSGAGSASSLARQFRPDNGKFAPLAAFVKERIPESARVVDLGSRYGVFPWLMRESFGVEAYGIEINKTSVELGRSWFDGLLQGGVEDTGAIAEREGWNRVHAFVLDDVLEHLVHPLEVLRDISQLQRPGDRLFLRQMDLDGIGHRLYGRDWYYLQPAAHMTYFNERSLRRLLQRVGYNVVEVVRAPAFRNLMATIFFEAPLRMRRQVQRSLTRRPANKPLYLTRRKKARDDMFMVVAEKAATGTPR